MTDRGPATIAFDGERPPRRPIAFNCDGRACRYGRHAKAANLCGCWRSFDSSCQHAAGEVFMMPVAMGSAIGAAAVAVGRGAVEAVGNGLSFVAELTRQTAGANHASRRGDDRQEAAKAELKLRRTQLTARIEQRLKDAGLQLTAPVELVSDGLGGIAVAGPHPQTAVIEEALGADVLLEHEFNELARDYELAVSGAGDEMTSPMTISLPHSAPRPGLSGHSP
jgi:hypothetical protein